MVQLNMITAAIYYNKIQEMRKHSQKIEEELQALFPIGSFNILSIPDTAPAEIPRMIGTSKEKVNVQLAPVMANIMYIPQNKELAKSEENLDIFAKTPNLITDILLKRNIKITYIGITANYVYSQNNLQANTFLEKHLFRDGFCKTPEDVFDLLGKVTFVRNNKYYENIQLSNYREDINECHKIGIAVDINDRYQINVNPQLHSDKDSLQEILSMHHKFIREKLLTLQKSGELIL